MEDYELCEVCRLVTVTAMKSPGGFVHYSDVMDVLFNADECRLCSLMFAALREDSCNKTKLKSIINAEPCGSDPTWTVRLWLGDLTEWKFDIEVDGEEGPYFPDLGFVIVVVTCFSGNFPEDEWKVKDGENIMHGTIEVCDQMVLPRMNSPKRLSALSSSDLSFSIIRDWIKECDASHDKCKMIRDGISAEFLPPRLIDVGPHDGSRQPFLCVVSEDLKGEQHGLRYTALSYCWGKRGTLWTTGSNISERREEIALKDFPGTIRDAVLITRKLGIQYLWVDALCILQSGGNHDEKAQYDWEQHSHIMGDIYGNAFVTLGAAAAMHANYGIFHERKLPRYCRIPLDTENETESIDLCSGTDREDGNFHISHEMQPLYKRAWAFQEKALSKRFLAYQTGQIYWLCPEEEVIEDGTTVPVYSDTLSAYSTETWNSSTWRRLVEKYSKTEATYEKDKLPALSGLAKTIQEMSKDTYVAGLWKNTILDGLIWKTRKPAFVHRPTQYRAPSWSWAALDGEVAWLRPFMAEPYDVESWKYEVQYVARFVDDHITISGSNPFGEVACGYMSIDGLLKSLDESELQEFGNAKSRIRIFPDTADLVTESHAGNTSISPAGLGLFMMPIREEYLGCMGLVLRYNHNRLSYRRVGLFWIPSWRRDGSSWWFDGCEEQTIDIE
ncbi:heterokaryon incompatibility protein-domain-containing protein [Rhexocercosporidium sp. MPI-PUGE-AT-0058]|nr:heterokaryon incompatibility protein-domain-containing protein [Rhexocercosporidium sp. MPI-PUGE-AT-0058]